MRPISFCSAYCKLSAPYASHLNAFPATTVAALSNDFENQLASLFTTVLGADNLNSLVLGLVARNLDLGASLLAELVDGGTSLSDDKPMSC